MHLQRGYPSLVQQEFSCEFKGNEACTDTAVGDKNILKEQALLSPSSRNTCRGLRNSNILIRQQSHKGSRVKDQSRVEQLGSNS